MKSAQKDIAGLGAGNNKLCGIRADTVGTVEMEFRDREESSWVEKVRWIGLEVGEECNVSHYTPTLLLLLLGKIRSLLQS